MAPKHAACPTSLLQPLTTALAAHPGKAISYQSSYEGACAHFPTYRTSRSEPWVLRRRLAWCNVAIRTNELPPDVPEYGDLELHLAARNNGKPLDVPGIRPLSRTRRA
jgi:hypothetical protein